MEFFGVIAFFGGISFIMWLATADEVSKLSNQLRTLKKKIKGENSMSKLITSLIGKEVKIYSEGGVLETISQWIILEADEDWVKIQRTDKKGNTFTQIIRIDNIKRLDLVG